MHEDNKTLLDSLIPLLVIFVGVVFVYLTWTKALRPMIVHWRIRHTYVQATCKILDERVQPKQRLRSFDPKYIIYDLLFEKLFRAPLGRRAIVHYEPIFSLEYTVGSTHMKSEGYD